MTQEPPPSPFWQLTRTMVWDNCRGGTRTTVWVSFSLQIFNTIPAGKDTRAHFRFRTWITNSIHIHIRQNSWDHRIWIRYTDLALFTEISLIRDTKHIRQKLSCWTNSNSIRIHIRQIIIRNSNCIYSRAHGTFEFWQCKFSSEVNKRGRPSKWPPERLPSEFADFECAFSL